MPIRTEITFHDMPANDGIEAAIHRWVARLEHMYDRIVACHVVVDQPHRRHRQGGAFHLRVVLSVPGEDLAVNQVRHEDVYVAIADAFRAVRRQLQDQVATRRDFVRSPLTIDRASAR